MPAANIAANREERLRPLPARSALRAQQKPLADLRKRNAVLRSAVRPKRGEMTYRIVEDGNTDSSFYRPLLGDGELISVINTKHGFYRKLYEPLTLSDGNAQAELVQRIQLLLLAAARAEAVFTRQDELAVIETFRREWSEALEVLLSSK